ncbi:MAG: hypothetical protein P1R74_02880 [Sedimenticola sp.]|nr:hypothetical protein [Sedimenticola sp.]
MVLTLQRQIIVGLLLSGLLVSLPVAAQRYRSPEGQPYSQNGRSTPRGVDLDSTVERIRRETGGRVLHAETMENDGHQEHRVRIITDHGKVRRYRIDAGSGRSLSPRD